MKILTFTTLYPNAAMPSHGVFVEERLRHIAETGEATFRVVAPVPWFPIAHKAFGKYGLFARAPGEETRRGLKIVHPRYPVIPKVGMLAAPRLLAAWSGGVVAREIAATGGVDLIDVHYFYPDGVAAARLARRLGVPFVVTARGADVNQIAQMPGARDMVRAAARAAAAIITVSSSLRDRLIDLGAEADKIEVIHNGIDLETFRPDAAGAFSRDQFVAGDETLLLSVGQLIERKGHHLTIEALTRLPGARLVIAGDGPLRGELEAQAAAQGVADRVTFLGLTPHGDLASLYAAADIHVLASSSEGMANVLLESLACGTPVAATPVDGALELVTRPEAGQLMAERSVASLVEAVSALRAAPPRREDVRRYAEGFPWEKTAQKQLALYRRVIEAARV